MFIEKINQVTGAREWAVEDDDYDCAQELARSRFGDMILDYDRNDMFLAGLKTVIQEKKHKGERVHVLDIGTGTGLLSLMAAREGADQVTALEVFAPMAECATKITQTSDYKDIITVKSARSTDVTSLEKRPNVIVAEVFDTELNGEGALRTFKEALENLVQPGTRVVPSLGRVWILPVESEYLAKFNRAPAFRPAHSDHAPSAPPSFAACPGTSAVYDLQLSQLDATLFRPLTDKILAFDFDFEDASKIIYDESFVRDVVATATGRVDAVMMWWDLDMDRTGKNWIDMAPTWVNPNSAWRDHWMQAVYYPPRKARVTEGERVRIECAHDEFSMWFGVKTADESLPRPYCSCSMHNILARSSIYRMNTLLEDEKLGKEIEKVCSNRSIVAMGEGSLIGLMAAPHATHVVIVDSNPHFRLILERYRRHLGMDNVQIVESLEEVTIEPSAIISEPFYLSAMLPWDQWRWRYDGCSALSRWPRASLFPSECRLLALPCSFSHLHHISHPVGVVNGFDLSEFDRLSQKARMSTDALVEEHPLWEYEGVATGAVEELMRVEVGASPCSSTTDRPLAIPAETNGLAMWCEWQWAGATLTTGPVSSPVVGGPIEWSPGSRQGVYLPASGRMTQERRNETTVRVKIDGEDGSVAFAFV